MPTRPAIEIKGVKDGLTKMIAEISRLRDEVMALTNTLRDYKRKHPLPQGVIGGDGRGYTDEPLSHIEEGLMFLGKKPGLDPLSGALHQALKDLDGALRDIRSARSDVDAIANDPDARENLRVWRKKP